MTLEFTPASVAALLDPFFRGMRNRRRHARRGEIVRALLFATVAVLFGLFVFADPLASLLGAPEASHLLEIMSLLIPLQLAGDVAYALLARRMNFSKDAVWTMLSEILGALVAVGAALLGFGVWSLLAQLFVSAFIRLAGLNKVAEVTIRPLEAPYRLVRFLKGPAGTQCYAISPEAARMLLAKAGAWIEPVDDYLDRFWTHGVQSVAILPFHIRHDVEERSDIGDTRANRERSFVGPVGRTASRLYASLARRLSNIRHIGLAASRSR